MPIRIHISTLLGQRKMTQKELSDLTGIRPNTISNMYYETVKRIEVQHIEALCKALKCSVGEIIEYIEEE